METWGYTPELDMAEISTTADNVAKMTNAGVREGGDNKAGKTETCDTYSTVADILV